MLSQRDAILQGYHVEKQIFERSELEGLEAALDADLKKAAGANYDMGASARASLSPSHPAVALDRARAAACADWSSSCVWFVRPSESLATCKPLWTWRITA